MPPGLWRKYSMSFASGYTISKRTNGVRNFVFLIPAIRFMICSPCRDVKHVCAVCVLVYKIWCAEYELFRKKRDNKLKKISVVQTNSQDFDCFFFWVLLYICPTPQVRYAAAAAKRQTPDTSHQRVIINDQIYMCVCSVLGNTMSLCTDYRNISSSNWYLISSNTAMCTHPYIAEKLEKRTRTGNI